MAGVNVKPAWLHYRVLVCWDCGVAQRIGAHAIATWEQIGPAAKRKTQWKKNNRLHWQTLIHGEVLDYWPTKRKWRYGGETQVGDVEQFIKRVS